MHEIVLEAVNKYAQAKNQLPESKVSRLLTCELSKQLFSIRLQFEDILKKNVYWANFWS